MLSGVIIQQQSYGNVVLNDVRMLCWKIQEDSPLGYPPVWVAAPWVDVLADVGFRVITPWGVYSSFGLGLYFVSPADVPISAIFHLLLSLY